MFDFHQKRKLKSVMTSRITQGCILAIALVVAYSAFARYQIAADMAERRAVVETEAAALEARKASLEEQVQYLSDERGVEAEMRRQFDVAKDGEQVVVIVEAEEETVAVPVASSTDDAAAWYEFWR